MGLVCTGFFLGTELVFENDNGTEPGFIHTEIYSFKMNKMFVGTQFIPPNI